MTNAPPNVPGTPIILSTPVRFRLIHSLTNRPSITPDSATTCPLLNSNWVSVFAGVITIPSIPESATSKFEPEPTK